MSETVRVDLRQATLSEHARLREVGERLFLALENPPPVRSLLRVHVGDERKAFEVARVIEVVDESEPARGCYGRYVELERLSEQDKVGSEHLEPGIVGGGGVPAPVVIMNSGEMLLGEASEESELAAASEGEGEQQSEAAEASEPATDESTPTSDDAPE
ncbi:MAG TPA: hypothetical protein VM869_35940 [Enhygromyxa sp.]|nr:hypothetical protein [Enhygromyxa sp.]